MSNAHILFKRELDKFHSSATQDSLLTAIKDSLTNLQNLEIIKFLRLKGRCILTLSPNPIEDTALNGARSSGYQECLDDLENFIDFFILVPQAPALKSSFQADYGGMKSAFLRGDISKDEYDRFTKQP